MGIIMKNTEISNSFLLNLWFYNSVSGPLELCLVFHSLNYLQRTAYFCHQGFCWNHCWSAVGSPERNVKFFTWLQIPVVWKILLFILRENELDEVLGSSIFPMPWHFCHLISFLWFCPKEGTLPGIHWLDFGEHSHPARLLLWLGWPWAGKAALYPPLAHFFSWLSFCHARRSVASALCEAEGS